MRFSGHRALVAPAGICLGVLCFLWTIGSSASEIDPAIAPVAVVASSTQAPVKSVDNLINGTGLRKLGSNPGVWVHGNEAYQDRGVRRGTMWCSGTVNGQPDAEPILTFDLGKPQAVGSLRVWNYNEANWTSVGVQKLAVETSADGQRYEPQGVAVIKEAPGRNEYEGQLVSFQAPATARYIRMRCLSNWGGERFGLSEVRFYAAGSGAKDVIKPGVVPPIATTVQANVPNPPRPALPGAENMVFPSNCGNIDVTAAPYNAKGDGVSDDSAAIQQALSDYASQGAIIYLPNGVYRITRTLTWSKDQRLNTLQGQSRAGTIIRLADGCPGFAEPANPREMVYTGGTPAQRFRNQIRNCTFDTGKGNPGAIGVRFDASNVGCLRDVEIRSGDGTGVVGLDMAYADDFGPCFVKNLRVSGFDTGIATSHGVNGVVFENITLSHQRLRGWSNEGAPITVGHLVSDNAGPAIVQGEYGGLLTLIDATLTGTGREANVPAISLEGGDIYVRDLRAQGYASAISARGNAQTKTVAGPVVEEWASARLPGSGATGLHLPVKQTPEVPWDDLKDWAVITDYGAAVDGHTDDSDAIQRAIDSGKSTVCLPRGSVAIKKPIILRGNVRRLIGCETFLKFPTPLVGAKNIFTVGPSSQPVLVVERMASWFWDNQSRVNFIDNPTSRTLVLREMGDVDDTSDALPNGRGTLISGPGELFVEDVTGRFHIKPGVKAWMRYVNPETNQDHRHTIAAAQWHLQNEGGRLWILGIKTEGPGPVLITRAGGQSELLGGLMYSSGGARTQDQPAFIIDDSRASFTITEANFSNNAYRTLVRWKRSDGSVFELNRGQTSQNAGGSVLPLWSTP